MKVLQFFTSRMKLALLLGLALLATSARLAGTSAWTTPQGRDEVHIALTSNGFAPTEVQHAPGTFAIAVENEIISGEYTLRLTAADGTVVSEQQIQKGSSAWTVSLQTGRYTLSEVNHSQWTCSIVVQ